MLRGIAGSHSDSGTFFSTKKVMQGSGRISPPAYRRLTATPVTNGKDKIIASPNSSIAAAAFRYISWNSSVWSNSKPSPAAGGIRCEAVSNRAYLSRISSGVL
jgi:hypothetical protein